MESSGISIWKSTLAKSIFSNLTFQNVGALWVVSCAVVSARHSFSLASFSVSSLSTAVSGVKSTPCDFKKSSPKFPCIDIPSIRSTVLTEAFFSSTPSISICFFTRGSNWIFTVSFSTFRSVSWGLVTVVSWTTKFSGKESEIRCIWMFIPVACEAYDVALSTIKFWIAGI